jgi:hypothetical protein
VKSCISLGVLLLALVPVTTRGEPTIVSREKAEMMGRVEDFMLHNFRDVTWRKSVEWGNVVGHDDGSQTIRYTYEAKIWDKEQVEMSQEFTFAADGTFVRYENVTGYPKKMAEKQVDVTSREGMIDLVEDFFGKNYRDITARKSLEWGEPIKDKKGNTSISYKFEATIWDKDKKTMYKVFTFDPSGKFVSVADAKEEPAQSARH